MSLRDFHLLIQVILTFLSFVLV